MIGRLVFLIMIAATCSSCSVDERVLSIARNDTQRFKSTLEELEVRARASSPTIRFIDSTGNERSTSCHGLVFRDGYAHWRSWSKQRSLPIDRVLELRFVESSRWTYVGSGIGTGAALLGGLGFILDGAHNDLTGKSLGDIGVGGLILGGIGGGLIGLMISEQEELVYKFH